MGRYIILMGVQGAGKGEQAKVIARRFGLPHVSTGELFRAIRTRDDALGQEVRRLYDAGSLITDDVTQRVVADRLSQPDAANGVIFDGFPRTPAQAAWLDGYLKERGEAVTVALYFTLDLFLAFKRAFGRVTDAQGTSYNVFTHADSISEWRFENHPEGQFPPRLVAIGPGGVPLTQRADDANAFAVIKRIDTYLATTMPLVAYYTEAGKLVEVNADQPIEQVSADVMAAIEGNRP